MSLAAFTNAKHFLRLQKLCVRTFDDFNIETWLKWAEMPRLTELWLATPAFTTYDFPCDFKEPIPLGDFVKKCPNVEVLHTDLLVTSDELKVLAAGLKNLRELFVVMPNNTSASEVVEVLKNVINLRKLRLKDVDQMNDENTHWQFYEKIPTLRVIVQNPKKSTTHADYTRHYHGTRDAQIRENDKNGRFLEWVERYK